VPPKGAGEKGIELRASPVPQGGGRAGSGLLRVPPKGAGEKGIELRAAPVPQGGRRAGSGLVRVPPKGAGEKGIELRTSPLPQGGREGVPPPRAGRRRHAKPLPGSRHGGTGSARRYFAPGILTFPALSAIVVISRAAW
jgi:hypothetical protein